MRPHGQARSVGLDVVRATAILLVMASHYANNLFVWTGTPLINRLFFLGDLGVELFFVLSGLLIGGILLDLARDARPGSLRVFLVRRWMRTLPLYWLCLLALALAYPPRAAIGPTVWHFATLTQNLATPMPAGDWFAVSWSLAVEEWFYLLFGTAVLIGARRWKRRWAMGLPLALLLTVPLLLRLTVPAFPDAASGLLKQVPFRLDEIGYGVGLAWLRASDSRLLRRPALLLACGVALLIALWWQLLPLSGGAYQQWRYGATALGCALCLPAALRMPALPRWAETLARTLSRQAYALYLIHLTIIVDLVQPLWWFHRVSTGTAVALALVLPFPLAALLSRCVERPIMRLRPPQPGPGGGGIGVAGASARH